MMRNLTEIAERPLVPRTVHILFANSVTMTAGLFMLLDNLSPGLLRNEEARAEVQIARENLCAEIKRHRAKGHDGKRCPVALSWQN